MSQGCLSNRKTSCFYKKGGYNVAGVAGVTL